MSEHKEFDDLHKELMELLDLICRTDDPSHAKLRFGIIERYGYQIEVMETTALHEVLDRTVITK